MHRLVFPIGLAILVATISGTPAASADPIYVEQGPQWTPEARADFYTHDQGSRLIRLSWLQALKGKDGRPFLADSMSRYGFLPNPDGSAGLPVGFHTSGSGDAQLVGVTCSACHTRQLEVAGKAYRVDGGPSLTDFQAFLGGLDKAVGDATADDASFAAFAASVLQTSNPAATDVAALRQRVDAWYRCYHAWASATLPPDGWGLGRLDAVGIIFNRIAGTDIGPPPDMLIRDNMRRADAPVRYPFLWNSPVQNLTDWGGFVLNGNNVLALSRNTGQALSFASFEPKRSFGPFFSYANSIDFGGLEKLEERLRQMGPPKWPKEWPINASLAADGAKIFDTQCSGCHGIKLPFSLFKPSTWLTPSAWDTPVKNVGTDTHQFDELAWKVKTGSMKGAGFPFVANRLQEEDYAVHMMFSAVVGSILEYKFWLGKDTNSPDGFGTLPPSEQTPASGRIASADPQALAARSDSQKTTDAAGGAKPAVAPDSLTIEPGTLLRRTLHRGAYEARVLQGIWAAAPYLHNGSVPTLAELLKPAPQRVSQFKLGTKYDIDNVGLAATQDASSPTRTVTGCDKRNSGDSNCGHEFGTRLSDPQKKALLEYLKTL
jgi:mono/diheme cytochrome c family protein